MILEIFNYLRLDLDERICLYIILPGIQLCALHTYPIGIKLAFKVYSRDCSGYSLTKTF